MRREDDGFKDFVLDQLTDLRGITCRAMFGGYGLYREGAFFGIISKGRLYFKTDPTTAQPYRERGMKPFKPNRTQTLKNYYEVPIEIVESPDDLAAWADLAAER